MTEEDHASKRKMLMKSIGRGTKNKSMVSQKDVLQSAGLKNTWSGPEEWWVQKPMAAHWGVNGKRESAD